MMLAILGYMQVAMLPGSRKETYSLHADPSFNRLHQARVVADLFGGLVCGLRQVAAVECEEELNQHCHAKTRQLSQSRPFRSCKAVSCKGIASADIAGIAAPSSKQQRTTPNPASPHLHSTPSPPPHSPPP